MRVAPEWREKLKRLAQARGVTDTEAVRAIVEEAYERMGARLR